MPLPVECQAIRDEIRDAVTNRVNLHPSVAEHVAGCRSCADYLETVRDIVRVMPTLQNEERAYAPAPEVEIVERPAAPELDFDRTEMWRRGRVDDEALMALINTDGDVLQGMTFEDAVRHRPLLAEALVWQRIHRIYATYFPFADMGYQAYHERNEAARSMPGGENAQNLVGLWEQNWNMFSRAFQAQLYAAAGGNEMGLGTLQTVIDHWDEITRGFGEAQEVCRRASRCSPDPDEARAWMTFHAVFRDMYETIDRAIHAPHQGRGNAMGPVRPGQDRAPAPYGERPRRQIGAAPRLIATAAPDPGTRIATVARWTTRHPGSIVRVEGAEAIEAMYPLAEGDLAPETIAQLQAEGDYAHLIFVYMDSTDRPIAGLHVVGDPNRSDMEGLTVSGKAVPGLVLARLKKFFDLLYPDVMDELYTQVWGAVPAYSAMLTQPDTIDEGLATIPHEDFIAR